MQIFDDVKDQMKRIPNECALITVP